MRTRKVDDFINRISNDLDLIDTQQNKDEILVEYKKDLNISKAITEVTKRKEQLRQLEEKRINQNLENEKKQIENNLQQLANANTQQVVHIEMNENHEIAKQSHEELEKVFNKEIEETQIKPKVYTITFKVTGTAPKLKELKEYLIREGYQYE